MEASRTDTRVAVEHSTDGGVTWGMLSVSADAPACQAMRSGDGTYEYSKEGQRNMYRWPDGREQ